MYWDGENWVEADVAEIARRANVTGKVQIVTWRFGWEFNAGTTVEPADTEKAFAAEPDPEGIICRPCQEKVHAECEGTAVKCRCQLCALVPFIVELEEDWDLDDKIKGWPQ